MSRNDEMKGLLEQTRFNTSSKLKQILYFLIIIGFISFGIGVFLENSFQVWQSLLVNTIFFAGLALGGLTYSVIFTVTGANWGRPIKRLAEGLMAFFPIGVVLFIILFLGITHFFEWVDHDKVIHSKAGWLNPSFFVIRNIMVIIVMLILSWIYLKASIRPDIGLAKKLIALSSNLSERFVKGYGSQESEEQHTITRSRFLAPVVGFAIAVCSTLLAFDWMMSIDQEWFSTMFGVQYAISNLVAASAALLIIAGIARDKLGLQDYITTDRYHDLAKLTFSGSALWTYLIFSQVLVIWYANIPEETPYLILRMQSLEWSWMFWLLFFLMFIIPFFGLMSSTACQSIRFSRLIAIELLIGTWLEKYFLIVPSIQENNASAGLIDITNGLPGFMPNIFDLTITAAVGSAFVLTYLLFLEKIPLIPISDKRFFKKSSNH